MPVWGDILVLNTKYAHILILIRPPVQQRNGIGGIAVSRWAALVRVLMSYLKR